MLDIWHILFFSLGGKIPGPGDCADAAPCWPRGGAPVGLTALLTQYNTAVSEFAFIVGTATSYVDLGPLMKVFWPIYHW